MVTILTPCLCFYVYMLLCLSIVDTLPTRKFLFSFRLQIIIFFPMYHTFLLSWFLYATDLSVCQWPRSIEIDQGHGNVWKISVRKTI